ncbi:BCCT family transporter [Nocardiopsis sp. HNM0947]|uniref:BCCT family transporter n=1 Tax=Nocardiopsis coralli TaxID=2772213 RepID=A0ABR9P4N5_9ACTN|nr:BCCT family transporter [Nocardiopsis coralli]MBE2998685.1 BCCT family transporter [Nocardiopsis coralli]
MSSVLQQNDGKRPSVWQGLSKPVFVPAVLIVVGALALATWYGAEYGDDAEAAFSGIRDGIGETLGWWYVLAVTVFLVFSFWAALSKAGNVRLGRDDEKPEFSLFTWFVMLFAAGMGIGLVFWGVAEPLNHMVAPPEVLGMEPGSEEAGRAAIGQAIFHWGLHAWGIYVVVGLGLAYMTFRRGRPLSVRWLLEPVFGRKLIESWLGHAIDVFAVVGTMFGVATSLGQGVLQIQAGLAHLGWFEPSDTLLVGLVVIITAVATISVISGLYKGLRWLSHANMGLAALLALAVLLLGPTVFLFQSLVQNTGEYVQALPELMFVTGAGADDGWTLGWTLFTQSWFLSWAPFVGMFIARISRGRTVREFILGVILAPTVVAIVWFTVFGSTGIHYQITQGGMIGEGGVVDTDTSLFTLFENLPIGPGFVAVLSMIAIVVIGLFFVTSADTCSLVVDVLCHGGRTETPRVTRLFWAALVGVSGALLLLAGGEAALTVLQVSSLAGAAPLSVIYVVATVALVRMLRYEIAVMPRYVRIRPQATTSALVSTAKEQAGDQQELGENLRDLLRVQNSGSRHQGGFSSASATLAGLDPAVGSGVVANAPENGGTVLAVHDVAPQETTVDPDTGALDWSEEDAIQDPLAGEVFDTPEFAESAAGAEQETEELLREHTGQLDGAEAADDAARADDTEHTGSR